MQNRTGIVKLLFSLNFTLMSSLTVPLGLLRKGQALPSKVLPHHDKGEKATYSNISVDLRNSELKYYDNHYLNDIQL